MKSQSISTGIVTVTMLIATPLVVRLTAQVQSSTPMSRLMVCADIEPKDGALSDNELRKALMKQITAVSLRQGGCDMNGNNTVDASDTVLMVQTVREARAAPAPNPVSISVDQPAPTPATPTCGNGKIDVGEECDDGNIVDNDTCSNVCKKVVTGTTGTTTTSAIVSVCGNGTIESSEECDDGNTIDGDACPRTCTTTPFSCGNRIREGVEKCDDGNIISSDSCPNDCGVSICGDGKVGKGEECDIANNSTHYQPCSPKCTRTFCGDGALQRRYNISMAGNVENEFCDDAQNNGVKPVVQYGQEAVYCTAQCTPARVLGGKCGDGSTQLNGGEECDDANNNETDFCTSACKKTYCGDGVRSLAEQCDDGNTEEGDSCTTQCQQPRCGDRILSGLEECDDGNIDNTDGCSTSCKKISAPTTPAPICGNGILEAGERCDDGNTRDNDQAGKLDGCSSVCLLTEKGAINGSGKVCGDSRVQPELKEECDDGNLNDRDNCSRRCSLPVCGDGKRTGMEECDDGNSDDDDFCSNACTRPVCGNGTKESGEECDDGNTVSGDSCPSNCLLTPATCPNGIREGVELCDDGNTINTDSCPSGCGASVCGNGKVESGEECDYADKNIGAGYQPCSKSCTLTYCGDGERQRRYDINSKRVEEESCDQGVENISVYDAKFTTRLPYSLQRVEVPKCSFSCTPITMFNRYCGDGIVETDHGEECDDANTNTTDGCTATCKIPVCGDGIKSFQEQCDDGNSNNEDGCTTKCQVMTVIACGNGIVENYPNEECDDRNTNDNDNCRNNCKLPRCGDGILDITKERCDEGAKNGQKCTPAHGETCTYCGLQCQPEWLAGGRCGDRVVQAGEACDDGKNGNDHDTCTDACTLPICGDHIKDTNEECDDGNRVDADTCSNSCIKAKCGDSIIQTGEQCDGNWTYCNPAYGQSCQYCDGMCQSITAVGPRCGDKTVDTKHGEDCDDGNRIDTDSCPNSCRQPRCGDGVKTGVEQCDDGNTVDGDACTATCQAPRCGDYVVSIGEECDDGNGDDKDDCSNTCKKSRCGDGITQSCFGRWFCRLSRTEECDDGNNNDTDFCTNACMAPRCGDGIKQGSEQCDDGNRIDNDACTNLCLTCNSLCQRTR